MRTEEPMAMNPDVNDRIDWSSRIVRIMGLGEVLTNIEGSRMCFMIRKNGIITYSFNSLEQFERFADTSMKQRSSNKRFRVRSANPVFVPRNL